MKNDKVLLIHIVESIEQIKTYVPGKDDFYGSRLIQDAVIRNLEIIGEAVKNISNELRLQHKDIPWREMAGLRDVLIHNYFGVDLRTVWNVVHKELPLVNRKVKGIIEDMD